uniref:Serrate RNA effector molecule homolog n=1 Tax=Acrobeloides nanus TaxID=290746 RepID=A0A914C9K1_9BILA
MKRTSNRRDDEPTGKRGRFDTASDSYEPQFIKKDEGTGTVMLTFKKFLATVDDSISDDEAITKYNEYKVEFKRQQIQKFFDVHKDEEWFRLKYHPEEMKARKDEQQAFLQKRLDVFTELFESGAIGGIKLNHDAALEIIRLLDTVVIKLEGGTEEDILEMRNEPVDDESVLELKKANPPTEPNKSEEKIVKAETNGDTQPSDVTAKEVEQSDAANLQENKEDGEVNVEAKNDEKARKRPPLHKTCSIFFRTIPSTITIAEIEAVCKQHPGFLRLGISDPLPDQKFSRRGWVTYRRDVNIKEIFWSLKSVRVAEYDLGASVNRDLRRRVRVVNGITSHKPVAQNDLRQAAKLIALHDHRAGLYFDDEVKQGPLHNLELAITQSHNPILKGITEYLVEEVSAEEDELLGLHSQSEEDVKHPFERDDRLLQVLDKLVLYLRIVHSIDFYNHGDYPYEDNMPNRLGLIHVRDKEPDGAQFGKNDRGVPLISQKFMNDFTTGFNERLESHLLKNTILTEEELVALGKKDPEKELEDFVTANSVQLAPDKWLCPLSGKKFKGPEFIHKHLSSKHQDKLDEIKDAALYYNNYVTDPERPHDPEPKPALTAATNASAVNALADEIRRPNEPDRGFRPSTTGWNDRPNLTRYGGGGRMGGGGRDFGGNRGRFFDTMDGARMDRRQTSYRDLDAPDEVF